MMSIEILVRHSESHDDEEAYCDVTKSLGYNTRTLILAFEMPRPRFGDRLTHS